MPERKGPGAQLGPILDNVGRWLTDQPFAKLSAPPLSSISTALATPFGDAISMRHRVLQPWFEPEWMRHMREIGSLIGNMQKAMAVTWQPLAPMFAALAKHQAFCSRIEQAGWLPHYTTPLAEIQDVTDVEKLNEILNEHYENAWPSVRQMFEERLVSYEIDEEAKTAFSEALDAHEAGLFRTAVRAVFPEIERIVREELYGGEGDRIASVPKLIQAAGEMPAGSTDEPGGLFGLTLFGKLYEHLYANTLTEEDLRRCVADPVPNRHAALHGRVSYRTRQNSINALIMTDYIFQVVCAVKNNNGSRDDQ